MKEVIEKIKEVFGDCKRNQNSLCELKTSYEIISTSFFCVFDDIRNESQEPVRIVDTSGDYQLRVKNVNRENICLIKTDKCLFTDNHKKCDCILISKDKCFLVEISEATNRHRKRIDAVEQLSITIELLKDEGIDLTTFETKAIICFKSGKTKPTQTSFNTRQAIFNEKYKVQLEEGNFISF